MKSLLLLALCLMAVTATNAFPKRNARDVSELSADNTASIYLPPNVESQTEVIEVENDNENNGEKSLIDIANADETAITSEDEHDDDDDGTVVGSQGYVYKTVRRLRLRTQRDVSHLNRGYLPPPPPPSSSSVEAAAIPTPAIHYLPPIEDVRKPLKLSNEYLPPIEPETETETPTTEIPTTTTMEPTTTTTTTTEAITEPPTTTQVPILEELVDDTAILSDDGYHYKKPDVVPDLSPVREYLPPLEESIVVEESPDNDVSAILTDDGYRYRAIRRFKF